MRLLRALCMFSVLTAASFSIQAQSFTAVNVHIPYTVTVAGKQLSPGDYEIRPINGTQNAFTIYRNGQNAEAVLTAIPEGTAESAHTTSIVLRASGDSYVMDQMWIAGLGGYQFLGNGSSRSRESEKKVAVLPATTSSGLE